MLVECDQPLQGDLKHFFPQVDPHALPVVEDGLFETNPKRGENLPELVPGGSPGAHSIEPGERVPFVAIDLELLAQPIQEVRARDPDPDDRNLQLPSSQQVNAL